MWLSELQFSTFSANSNASFLSKNRLLSTSSAMWKIKVLRISLLNIDPLQHGCHWIERIISIYMEIESEWWQRRVTVTPSKTTTLQRRKNLTKLKLKTEMKIECSHLKWIDVKFTEMKENTYVAHVCIQIDKWCGFGKSSKCFERPKNTFVEFNEKRNYIIKKIYKKMLSASTKSFRDFVNM